MSAGAERHTLSPPFPPAMPRFQAKIGKIGIHPCLIVPAGSSEC